MDDLEADLFGDDQDLGFDEPSDRQDANKSQNGQSSPVDGGEGALSKALKAKIRDLAAGKLATDALKLRRVVPKVDINVLLSDRGLPRLAELTKKIQLKGRNHEVEDLRTIMHVYEYWAHTMAPRMAFDDVIHRLAVLGHKREIQTYLRRLRLNMLKDDHVVQHDNDSDDDAAAAAGKVNVDAGDSFMQDAPIVNSTKRNDDYVGDNFDEFDNLFDDDDRMNFEVESGVRSRSSAILYADDASALKSNFDRADDDATAATAQSNSNLATATQSVQPVSDDVQRRIEENRRKAIEKRMQVLQKRSDAAASSTAADNQEKQNDSINLVSAEFPEDEDEDNRPLYISATEDQFTS